MNGRVYDPALGRFLSVDPVFQFPTNTQSLNPYTYVLNSPLSFTDPTGLQCSDTQDLASCAESLKNGETTNIKNEKGGNVGTVGKDKDGNLYVTKAEGQAGHSGLKAAMSGDPDKIGGIDMRGAGEWGGAGVEGPLGAPASGPPSATQVLDDPNTAGKLKGLPFEEVGHYEQQPGEDEVDFAKLVGSEMLDSAAARAGFETCGRFAQCPAGNGGTRLEIDITTNKSRIGCFTKPTTCSGGAEIPTSDLPDTHNHGQDGRANRNDERIAAIRGIPITKGQPIRQDRNNFSTENGDIGGRSTILIRGDRRMIQERQGVIEDHGSIDCRPGCAPWY